MSAEVDRVPVLQPVGDGEAAFCDPASGGACVLPAAGSSGDGEKE